MFGQDTEAERQRHTRCDINWSASTLSECVMGSTVLCNSKINGLEMRVAVACCEEEVFRLHISQHDPLSVELTDSA